MGHDFGYVSRPPQHRIDRQLKADARARTRTQSNKSRRKARAQSHPVDDAALEDVAPSWSGESLPTCPESISGLVPDVTIDGGWYQQSQLFQAEPARHPLDHTSWWSQQEASICADIEDVANVDTSSAEGQFSHASIVPADRSSCGDLSHWDQSLRQTQPNFNYSMPMCSPYEDFEVPCPVIPVFLEKAMSSLRDLGDFMRYRVQDYTTKDRWLESTDHSIISKQQVALSSWRSYSNCYNATELLQLDQLEYGRRLLRHGMQRMLKSYETLSFRDISNMLCILWFCFQSCPTQYKGEFINAIASLKRQASASKMAKQCQPFFALINAILQLDTRDTLAKITLNRFLLNRVMEEGISEFDAQYELREQLIRLHLECDDLSAAREECDALIALSIECAQYHCDDTYRARRFEGRIHLKAARKHISAGRPDLAFTQLNLAEWKFKDILNDAEAYKDEFRQSAANKEWQTWEDLRNVANLRGSEEMEDFFFGNALRASIHRYEEESANTARILKAYLIKLAEAGRWADVLATQTLYPAAFAMVSSTTIIA